MSIEEMSIFFFLFAATTNFPSQCFPTYDALFLADNGKNKTENVSYIATTNKTNSIKDTGRHFVIFKDQFAILMTYIGIEKTVIFVINQNGFS